MRLNSVDFSYDLSEFLRYFKVNHVNQCEISLSPVWMEMMEAQIRAPKSAHINFLHMEQNSGDPYIILKRFVIALAGNLLILIYS